jgi:hypothetical protein
MNKPLGAKRQGKPVLDLRFKPIPGHQTISGCGLTDSFSGAGDSLAGETTASACAGGTRRTTSSSFKTGACWQWNATDSKRLESQLTSQTY